MDALASIMTEDDPYLVSEAVKAAGKIGGVKAMEQLQIMTHHRSFLVRGEVAKAIGSVDNPDLSELLDQLLKDISPYVEECARMALAAKKTKKASQIILRGSGRSAALGWTGGDGRGATIPNPGSKLKPRRPDGPLVSAFFSSAEWGRDRRQIKI